MKTINREAELKTFIKFFTDEGFRVSSDKSLKFHTNGSYACIDLNNNDERLNLEGIILTHDTRIYISDSEIIGCCIVSPSEINRSIEMVKLVGNGYALLNRYYVDKYDKIHITIKDKVHGGSISICNIYTLEPALSLITYRTQNISEDAMEKVFGDYEIDDRVSS